MVFLEPIFGDMVHAGGSPGQRSTKAVSSPKVGRSRLEKRQAVLEEAS